MFRFIPLLIWRSNGMPSQKKLNNKYFLYFHLKQHDKTYLIQIQIIDSLLIFIGLEVLDIFSFLKFEM